MCDSQQEDCKKMKLNAKFSSRENDCKLYLLHDHLAPSSISNVNYTCRATEWTGQHFQFERSLGHLFGNNYPFYLHNTILTFYLFICLLLQFLDSITDDDNKVLIKKWATY